MKRKPVTVSLYSDLLERYKKYCNLNGMMLSRRLEILMEKDLKNKLK